MKDKIEEIRLNFCNFYYFVNSPLNLISFSLLNNTDIYYNNKQQALYDKAYQKPLTFTKQCNQNLFLHVLNLSILAVNLLKTKNDLYKDIKSKIYQTQNDKLLLTVWHKQFDHLKFPILERYLAYLAYHDIYYIDNKYIYDIYEKTKRIKHNNCIL